jgi:hypothetical protein
MMRKSGGGNGGGFGQPKPLPGQAGYKVTQSEVLERESKEMEERLRMLQQRMAVQDMMDAAQPKPGGARWRGARADRGTLGAYHKDVVDKHKRKTDANLLMDPSTRARADERRNARKQSNTTKAAICGYADKEVSTWTPSDVGQWLSALNLGNYSAVFMQNEISGDVLLDVSLEDLDYMEIKILGHRKIILKGIEDLRVNKRVTIPLSARNETSANSSPTNGMSKTLRSQSTDDCMDSPQKALSQSMDNPAKRTHWSHLEPLSSNVVSEDVPSMGGNSADFNPNNRSPKKSPASSMGAMAGDVLDEAAEQEAFRQAVLEWRKSTADAPTKVTIVREGEQKAARSGGIKSDMETITETEEDFEGLPKPLGGNEGEDGGSLWRNPFGSAPAGDSTMDDLLGEAGASVEHAALYGVDINAEENQSSSRRQSQYEPLDSPTPSTKTVDAFSRKQSFTKAAGHSLDSPSRSAKPVTIAAARSSSAGSGDAFAALSARGSLAEGKIDEEKEHEEFRRAVDMWRTGKAEASKTMQAKIDALSETMESEQNDALLRIQKEKEEAIEKLMTATTLYQDSKDDDAKRMSVAGFESKHFDLDDDQDDVDGVYNVSVDPTSGYGNDYLHSMSKDSQPLGCDDDEDTETSALAVSSTIVNVSVLESVVHLKKDMKDGEVATGEEAEEMGGAYTVEEVSDDE